MIKKRSFCWLLSGKASRPIRSIRYIIRTLHSLPPSYRPFQSSWLSVPKADQTLLNLTSRLVAEESINKALNNGKMDPTEVAFFAGKLKQASVASNSNEETAMSARGVHSVHRRGGRWYRGRGGGYWGNRHDYENRQQYGDISSTIVCFSCEQTGKKLITFHEKKTKKENKKGTTITTRIVLRLAVSRDHCDSSRINRIAFTLTLPHPTTWLINVSFFTTFKEIPPGTWKVTVIGGVESCMLLEKEILASSPWSTGKKS